MPLHPSRRPRLSLSALALAAALAPGAVRCADAPTPVTTVKVVGDSLSDSGTFAKVLGARIASVQGSASEPYVLWDERVAQAYGLAPLCPYYRFTGLGFTTDLGCTNYAVSGSSINNPASAGGARLPLSVLKQLADVGAARWRAQDLLLISGGGNDASNLVAAYLGRADDRSAAFTTMLGALLPGEMLAQVLAGHQGAEAAGELYMRALADSLSNAIQTHALDLGAPRVLVSNMPDVKDTPRFQDALRQLAEHDGADTADRARALIQRWVGAYNQRLVQRIGGDARVRVFDLAAHLSGQVAHPARYGLANATLPVCGASWTTVLPERKTLGDCKADELTATPPPPGAPAGGDWWQHFLFADGFHPTPYGHQLFAQQVLQMLTEAGWR